MFNGKKFKDNKFIYFICYALLAIIIVFTVNEYFNGLKYEHIKYSDFVNYINQNKISQVKIGKDKLFITLKSKQNEEEKYFIRKS